MYSRLRRCIKNFRRSWENTVLNTYRISRRPVRKVLEVRIHWSGRHIEVIPCHGCLEERFQKGYLWDPDLEGGCEDYGS
jgi:hypothetical protein